MAFSLRFHWLVAARAVALALVFTGQAFAHGSDPIEAAPQAAAPGAPVEVVRGQLHGVVVDDRVAGAAVRYQWLKQADGSAVVLKGRSVESLAQGSRIEVTGQRNGKTLFARSARQTAPFAKARSSERQVTVDGVLRFIHLDYLEESKTRFEFEVEDAKGELTRIDLDIRPEALRPGMRVQVQGQASLDGSVAPDTILITELPPALMKSRVAEKATVTNNVLVILIRFTDSAANPFTQAQVQATVGGGPGSGSVAEYFKEVSYGQQLLNVTVTPWLSSTSATPANCDWRTIGSLARNAANASGYPTSSYQNLVYVFPRINSCGWSGLAYVGASGVWSNGNNNLLVYAHELGHNFGLLHAGSLDCGAAAIGGSCSASEYGDPFNVMGNQRAMHFNATQKWLLGWIAPSAVPQHNSGATTYTLSPLELAGGSTYAVAVPASSNRTYWLEYRQPIGFDAALSSYPNNGAQVRVASPLEVLCSGCDAYSMDTQVLDMTPGTGSFTDATLLAGTSFTDSAYGITFNVLSATPTALTLQVVKGSVPATTTSLASSQNPATAGATVTFTATVTGTGPTGSVSFTANGASISGCAARTLAGSGNSRTATCAASSLAVGTHGIVASYTGDGSNAGSTSATLNQSITPAVSGTNVALASNGATATASSTHSSGYAVSGINNNERRGAGWGSGSGGWNDASPGAWPDWVQINFNGTKTIDRVVVFTLQDNYGAPVEPTDTMTFSLYGVRDFTVQGWNGSSWVTLGTVTSNNLVKRTVTFAPYTTDRIRINVTSALASFSRITEVEAWGTPASAPINSNVALAGSGAVATASSTFNSGYAVGGINNNDRTGAGWGSGSGGWNDASSGSWPDWVQITFAGTRTIDRVIVFTLQDNYGAPTEPTDSMTFSQFGLRDFTVQAWNGSSWITLASVTGNTLVKRTVTFTPYSTDRIRINVTNALAGFARITEIEAWGQ